MRNWCEEKFANRGIEADSLAVPTVLSGASDVVIDCRIVQVQEFSTASDLFLRLDTLASDA
ncbi:MAG: hypothetical protein ABSE57_07195 [Bryobacteraceae bacterium]